MSQPDKASPSAPTAPDRGDPPAVLLSANPAESRRRTSGDRRWQIPCWLTSFVLHLLAIVVLGSLTVPVSRQRTVVAILLSFGAVDATNDDVSAELATTISLATIEDTVSPADHSASAEHVPAAQSEAPIIQQAVGLDASPGRPIMPQAGYRRPATSGPSAPAGGVDATAAGDSADNDEVVERFIQFDVGRLRGAEGEKARQGFERLGTESLPALIRGLNRSAKMHASCPVMVISQKVGTMLQQNPQPALVRYALDNIGRDVPPHAMHVGYLQQLMNQLRPLDPSYSGLNVPMLLASLKSRDVQGAIHAANIVASQSDKLMEFEKEDVAWALIHLLTQRAPDLRTAARSALVSLAQGKDCGPADDRRAADRLAAACKWSLELCPDRFEATAESLLKTAQDLAEAGKGEAARRYYRKLVIEYAGTQAADEAAECLKRPVEFAFK
jgi:hypothetical protein